MTDKETIEKAQFLFSSIVCIAAEGMEFMSKVDRIDAMVKEASKGYALCSEALGK